jgi:hypothetical protein
MLSPRQFRLALKTLVRTTSPPARISVTQPLLAESLLEMVRHRAVSSASSEPLPSVPAAVSQDIVPLSEQAVLIMSIIDSLPYLSIATLEEWLPLTAEALSSVQDILMRENCKRRFWEVLTNGDMDVPRSELAVLWWNTRGGREMVLNGISISSQKDGQPLMSGVLMQSSKL